MKFSISSTDLLKALTDVSKAIPAKSALPILENFLFVLKDNRLQITASDQELTLRTEIDVDSAEEGGSIAIPARHTIELLKVLPDQPLKIRTLNDSSFECSWSSGNSVLPYFPADDYPEIKMAGEDAQKVVFPAESLVDGIGGTVDVEASEKASFILHKKPANVLKSIIGKDVEKVEIAFDASTVVFTFGSTMMVCRLVVGKYPRYRDVIPQNNSNILKIDRQLLLNTVRRVAVCANKASNHIKFDLK